MTSSVVDFADTYSKMSDEQLSLVLSDEKSLVNAASVALHAEVQKRKTLASPSETGSAVVDQVETLWERQRRRSTGWLALWCIGTVLIGPLYFFFNVSTQMAQTSLWLGVFGNLSWVGIIAVVALAVQFIAVIFAFVTGLCVFAVKPFALRMVLIYFLLWALVEALICILIFLLVRDAGPNEAEAIGGAVGYLLRDLIVLFAWFIYFKRSKCVRETFGRNLLSRVQLRT